MTLLSDFKTEIGVTGTSQDQYFVDNFLRPALDKLTQLCVNIKTTKVTLVSGTQSYNLTSANPSVGAGIYELVFDGTYSFPYYYKRDVVLQNPTTLYFVSANLVSSGTLDLKYKAYYSSPVVSPTYVETDAPSNKLVYVKQWAVAHYKEMQTLIGSEDGAIQSKSEDGLSVSYGGDQMNIHANQKKASEVGMREGAQGDFKFFNIQVV
jgi:hypothetical protein